MNCGSIERADWERLIRAGHEAFLDGHYNLAATLCSTALEMAQTAGDIINAPFADLLMLIGDLRCELFDFAGAEPFYSRATVIYARLHSRWRVDVSIALSRLSQVCRIQGKLHEAILFQRQATDILKGHRLSLELLFSESDAAVHRI